LGLSSEQPVHFCEGKAELLPLGENVFMPGYFRLIIKVSPFPRSRFTRYCNVVRDVEANKYIDLDNFDTM
jgi:hypothetical protein